MELVLDIKIIIASYNEKVWYWFYQHDDAFKKYSATKEAIHLFTTLFTKHYIEESNRFYRESYYLLGKLHRMNGVAFSCSGYCGIYINDGVLKTNYTNIYNKYEVWCENGLIHRDKLPAMIDYDANEQVWYNHGKKHRDGDLPAIVNDNRQVWYHRGKIHRNNDLPAIIYYDTKSWYHRGKLHRDNDLPAVMCDDELIWYNRGKKHRDHDLPAHMYTDNTITKYKWWYYGKEERPNQLPI